MTTPIPQALADLNRQVQELKAENTRLREIERLYNEALEQEPVGFVVCDSVGTGTHFVADFKDYLKNGQKLPLFAAQVPQAPAVQPAEGGA